MFRGRNLINKLLKVSLLQRVGELSFVFNLFEFYKDLVKKRFRMKQVQHTLLLGKILFLLFRTECLNVIRSVLTFTDCKLPLPCILVPLCLIWT